jgi:hypothetical protein
MIEAPGSFERGILSVIIFIKYAVEEGIDEYFRGYREMVNDLCFKIEIFEIGKEYVKDTDQGLDPASGDLVYKGFESPGNMTDQVKGKRKECAQDRGGKAGKQQSDGCDQT